MILNSVIDVARAIRSGAVGVIPAIKIGDVTVSALTGLRGGDSVTDSGRPVQAGFTPIEGIVKNPRERTLSIVLADPEMSIEQGLTAVLSGDWAGFTETWRDKKNALLAHFDNLDIIEVVTHDEVFSSMFIRAITPVYDPDENWDCYIAEVEIKQWETRGAASATGVENAITAASVQVGAL